MNSSKSDFVSLFCFRVLSTVGAEIVNPQFLSPGGFGGRACVEEDDVGLDALGVDDW